ncbi:pyruvate carboxylase subunit B [Aquisalimonas lutea]|uniref:pyruvate carboxylase subunit B n=1 Tax=Aquisalimonas lutea TaxID=1327750 RepID=UPI0025B5A7A6|nr:pyruvate carboxylase subunit B [Aquisalimonas lutea]MDN3519809.1 pyruvate carboxylase subunit B [Aquisalimonas lutea]
MGKRVEIEDITIRDGAQCLWATRLSTEEIVPIAKTIDQAGFTVVDLTGGAAIDTSIMYLQEDPFERCRVLSELMPNSRLNFNSRGQSVFRWTQYPDDVAELTIRVFARNGIKSIMLFDPLNDMRNLEFSAKIAKEHGLYVIGSVTYTISPYHTDEHFVEKTRDLVEMGVDAVSLKDPSGLLTAERAVGLLRQMRSVLHGQALQLHCHTSTGTGEEVHKAAMDMGEEGPDVYHGAAPPLAWGLSHPSHEFLVDNLVERGFDVGLDMEAVRDMSAYLRYLAEKRGLPEGKPVSKSEGEGTRRHGVPGGMFSNLRSQLEDQGCADRLPEVLEEVQRVRHDLGYPLLVSPMAQYVGTTAVLNVLAGRYEVVPDEVRNYLLGYYGTPPGPVDENIQDKILNGAEPIKERPGEVLEPMVEEFRKKNGPFQTEEDLVLNIFYSKPILDKWNLKNWEGYRRTPKNATTFLMREAVTKTDIDEFSFENQEKKITVTYQAD